LNSIVFDEKALKDTREEIKKIIFECIISLSRGT